MLALSAKCIFEVIPSDYDLHVIPNDSCSVHMCSHAVGIIGLKLLQVLLVLFTCLLCWFTCEHEEKAVNGKC